MLHTAVLRTAIASLTGWSTRGTCEHATDNTDSATPGHGADGRGSWGQDNLDFCGGPGAAVWVPEAILYMGWARFWITLLAEVFIWGLFAVAFNLLMGYTGMISFGQAAYLGIGGYTAGLLLKRSAVSLRPGAHRSASVRSPRRPDHWLFLYTPDSHLFRMLTLAFSMIVYYIAFKWYDFTGGDNGLIGIPVPAGYRTRRLPIIISSC